jgi:hypothetical protein
MPTTATASQPQSIKDDDRSALSPAYRLSR